MTWPCNLGPSLYSSFDFSYLKISTAFITFKPDFCTISFFFSLDREGKLRCLKGSKNSEAIILYLFSLGQRKLSSLLIHTFQIPLFAEIVFLLYVITITGLQFALFITQSSGYSLSFIVPSLWNSKR